jgi:Zn-dependent M28 family amino/carboxypeptidase
MLRRLLTVSVWCMGSALTCAAAGVNSPDVNADNLARHIRVLASDEVLGRAPATAGEEKTVRYISDEFDRVGLQPAGDDGDWTQQVTLIRSELVGDVDASYRVGDRVRPLKRDDDIAVESLHPDERVDLQAAPLVFAGYGVSAPELGWDDYADLDVRDKVVVVLVNDPDFERGTGPFGGKAMTYYGRWTYKYEEAARRGAAGVLIVHETEPAAYPWATVRNGRNGPQFDIVRRDAASHHLKMRGWMQLEVARKLFGDVGQSFEEAKEAAQQAGFKGFALADATLSISFDVRHQRIITRNVAGLLPGTSQSEETVIVSGHWDSFGITPHADASGDNIINGAVDNATAIASIIELARMFSEGERPSRSLLFLALTAEESGLLGAKYYAARPLRPLATTAAVINLEMWSPDGPTRDISSWGLGKVSLERSLVAAAAVDRRAWSPDDNLEAGLFYRADHFAFAQAGVPAITIGPGMDQIDGGVAGGKAARADYFAKRYHQPGDEFDDSWDMRGPAQDTLTVYRLLHALANTRDWPHWDFGSEFAAERDKSAAARRPRSAPVSD